MKSYLLVCLVAAVMMATQGFRHKHMQESYKFQDEALSALDNLQDPGSGGPNPHDCDCDGICHDLNDDRLPKEIQDEHEYLSYENFPVLCRDAASIYLPPRNKEQKKYVCKQTFDCCRYCNAQFYQCLDNKANTYGFCMRGAYKCTCLCLEQRSFGELPYAPPKALT